MVDINQQTDETHVEAHTDRTARRFEMEIDIEASAAGVWNALTTAEELVRWFPIGAEVTPGAGGRMTWTWEGAWTWPLEIKDWQPGRRLRLEDLTARAFDAEGRPIDPARAAPAAVAIDITLEPRGGTTRLRLVHSGFGAGADWDNELDGVSAGWQFELRSLRHYLERHPGRRRHHGWAHVTTPWPEDKVWRFLLDEPALVLEAPPPQPRRPYVAHLRGVGRFSGVVLMDIGTRAFAGTASEFDDGIFRVETFRAGDRTGVIVWFATWSAEHAARVSAAGAQAAALLKRLLPA